MKNVYRKGKVHPQPVPAPALDAYSVLRLLPVAVATLSAALPAEDQEVLAYLIARSPDVLPLKDNRRNGVPPSSLTEVEVGNRKASQQFPWSHGPAFECSCFQCYTSFWSRWDASPNRQTIHEAIDLYEEHMAARAESGKANPKGKSRKGFKDKNPSHSTCADESLPFPATNDKSLHPFVQIEEEALKANSKNRKGFKDKNPSHSAWSDESFPLPATNDKSVLPLVQIEEEALKASSNSKQVEENTENENEESERARNSPPPPPHLASPLPIGGRGIMRRMFPNITTFIADHLWTAWTSPTGPEQ